MDKTTIQINTVILFLITLILLNPTAYCLTESTSSTIQTIEISFLDETTYYQFSKQTNGHFLINQLTGSENTCLSKSTSYIVPILSDIVEDTIKITFREKGEPTGQAFVSMDEITLEGKYIHKTIEVQNDDGLIHKYGLMDFNGMGDDCLYFGFNSAAVNGQYQGDCIITIPEGHLLFISRKDTGNWIQGPPELEKYGFTNSSKYRAQEEFLDQFNTIQFYKGSDNYSFTDCIRNAFQDCDYYHRNCEKW